MNRQHQQVWLGLGVFLGLLVSGMLISSATVEAQQTNLNETIRAVVRIRGCNAAGCNVGLGSGVVIHSSGVILTANHVTLTDKNNPLSPRLEDFVVELTESVQQSPHARYRARLLAAKPEADLALLGIYWDETANRPLDETLTVTLPALEAADASTIVIGEQLHILGYPLAGGSAINYTGAAMGGFDENGALIKVSASLSPGNSGGPALVERNGRYEIAGIVISGRGDRLEVGVIRSIDQFHTLTWEPTARRVWPENIQVIAQGQGASPLLQIRMDIHALDYTRRNGRLLAYVFDAQRRQPWPIGDDTLLRNASGQIVLRHDFSAGRMVDILSGVTMTIPLDALKAQPDQLTFRLLLWDGNEARALWRDEAWRHPQPGEAPMALAPTNTPAPTATPTPDLAATHTAQAAELETSIAATLTAQPAPTDTPTDTPDIAKTAVAAVLAAPPSNTPIVTTTHIPPSVMDEETALGQAAQAVVRILACQPDACEVGTGVLIDPNGIILTAWHVVARDPANSDSDFYQNLEIQMSDDMANQPETRYRAQVIAAKPDQDLALLRITYDVQQGRNITLGFGLGLPWLPLSAQTPRTAQLRIMGFPPVSDTISYLTVDQSGLEEGGALLKVQIRSTMASSGGPALLRRTDGAFEIVGLAIRRRGEDVLLIRNIRQLQGLKWQRGGQQVWAEAIEVRYDAQTLQVRLDLHALDLAGRQVQVRVLLFDASTNQPWSPASTNLPTTDTGQVFLDRTVAIERFAEMHPAVNVEAPVTELGVAPERLRFLVSLWDEERQFNFWQSAGRIAPVRM